MRNRVVASVLRGMEEKKQQIVNGLFFLILSAIALFIYIYVNRKSPDERVITKQACKNESIFSLFFSYLKNIYIHIYIYTYIYIYIYIYIYTNIYIGI